MCKLSAALGVIAVMMMAVPVPASATEFKCGKAFVTFPHIGGKSGSTPYPYGSITVAKGAIKVMGDAYAEESKLAKYRKQNPQYASLDDKSLADAIYTKHYSDMPRDQFDAAVSSQVIYVVLYPGSGGGRFTRHITPDIRQRIIDCIN